MVASRVLPLAALSAIVAAAGVLLWRSASPGPGGTPAAWSDPERPALEGPLPAPWPPVKGRPYPDVVLPDAQGRLVRIADLRGKVVIVEPIGMSCPGCQAFAGGNERPPFGGVTPQRGLPSYERLAGGRGLDINHPELVFVHLLLYDLKMGAPTVADARRWSDHWGLGAKANVRVLAGDPRYLNPGSYGLVPGFQLIDRAGVLVRDATGHHPQDGYEELMRAAAALLQGAE